MYSRKIEPLTLAYAVGVRARVSAPFVFNCRNRELALTLAFIYDARTSRYVTPDRTLNRTVYAPREKERERENYRETLSSDTAKKKREKGYFKTV